MISFLQGLPHNGSINPPLNAASCGESQPLAKIDPKDVEITKMQAMVIVHKKRQVEAAHELNKAQRELRSLQDKYDYQIQRKTDENVQLWQTINSIRDENIMFENTIEEKSNLIDEYRVSYEDNIKDLSDEIEKFRRLYNGAQNQNIEKDIEIERMQNEYAELAESNRQKDLKLINFQDLIQECSKYRQLYAKTLYTLAETDRKVDELKFLNEALAYRVKESNVRQIVINRATKSYFEISPRKIKGSTISS